jgi:lipoprotein NlpI
VTAFNDRGIAYGAKGDHDRAIKDFDQVVKLDAKNAIALNNRGIRLPQPEQIRPRHRRLRCRDRA